MQKTYSKSNSFKFGEVGTSGLEQLGAEYKNSTALLLRNVSISETGSVKRRDGLKFIKSLTQSAKLIPFEKSANEKYLLAFGHETIDIFQNDILIKHIIFTPFQTQHLDQLQYKYMGQKLYINHPDLEPHILECTDSNIWKIKTLQYDINAAGYSTIPFTNFEDNKNVKAKITPISAYDKTNNLQYFKPMTPDATNIPTQIAIEFTSPTLNSDDNFTIIRINSGEFKIKEILTESLAIAEILVAPTTYDSQYYFFTQQAFSKNRGWPKTVCFYQNRLILAGTKTFPNRLWFSQSDNYFNFDLGVANDGDAIEFDILSNQEETIQTIFAGRHTQIFTNRAEWIVTGLPLTPTSIQLNKQTEIGSITDKYLQPQFVDGSTMFVSKNEKEICEFYFGDANQSYQTNNLAILSEHLINTPLELTYNGKNNQLFVLNYDGSLAVLKLNKQYGIQAWTAFKTTGEFISITVLNQETYAIIFRDGKFSLEKFTSETFLDNTRIIQLNEGEKTKELEINNLKFFDELEDISQQKDKLLLCILDGIYGGQVQITDNKIQLPKLANRIEIGLPYRHIIAPSPEDIVCKKFRLLELSLRLVNSKSLSVDLGRGIQKISLKNYENQADFLDTVSQEFSGDIQIKSFGWQKNNRAPMWKIDDFYPHNFEALSIMSKYLYNN